MVIKYKSVYWCSCGNALTDTVHKNKGPRPCGQEPKFCRFKLVSNNYTPCCDGMMHAIDEEFIKFGNFDDDLNNSNKLNISTCSPYPEGASWGSMEIKFCPFCSEEIITEKVN